MSSFDDQTATSGSDYATSAWVLPLGINSISNNAGYLRNYPNPFSDHATISFFLPETQQASLEVFDLMGSRVNTLLNDKLVGGKHSISISALDLPAGIYLLKLQTDQFLQQKLIEVIK